MSNPDLAFAQAQQLEDLGRYDEAFAAFTEANALARAALPPQHQPAESARRMDEICGLMRLYFTPKFMRTWRSDTPAIRPIFIVGMPRSGSTLIEQILASHPDITALGETLTLARTAENAFPFHPTATPHKDHFGVVRRAYMQNLGKPKGRFTDKTMWNWCALGVLRLMFPRAVLIEAARDPVDTCFACYRTRFTAGQAFSYDLADLAAEYRRYSEMMAFWRTLFPVEKVQLEDLVADPETQIRRLVVDVCGLKWDDACLEFWKTDRAIHTASKLQVRQPIFNENLGRWRNYEAHLGPLKHALEAAAPAPVVALAGRR